MPEFLELLPPEEALRIFLSAVSENGSICLPEQSETIRTETALNRVTAAPVYSGENLPAFNRSTVDGFAVHAADTYGVSDSLPGYLNIEGEVPMGGTPNFGITRGEAALIHTGGMLPDGADAVVMLEYTQPSRPAEIEIQRAVSVGENILQAGEDVRKGQEVVAQGTRLRPAEIGGLMALGITSVDVCPKPRIGVLSSGDEVIPPDRVPQPGQVRDVNSYALSALIEQCGGEPKRYGILPDRREALKAGVDQALAECDAVVITAGSSASARDLTADVINAAGKPGVLVHGVNVRPGKPTILAVCDGKPVVGLPGNPVSALVIAGLFVGPLVRRLSGENVERPHPVVSAHLALNVASQAGREDWIPVRLSETADGWTAEPIFYKSNLIFMLARADGLMRIPAAANGCEVNQIVEVWLI
jgi:molybdopterin molybdotransferase